MLSDAEDSTRRRGEQLIESEDPQSERTPRLAEKAAGAGSGRLESSARGGSLRERRRCRRSAISAGRCGASSTAGELVPGGEGFQLRRSARRNNVVAEGERSEILWRTARLYSHTPRPFWRALARCIAIGSRGSAAPSLVQKVLKFEPMAVQLHCAIEKGFSSGKKETFPHTQYE
ncbi:hypothetical protein DPX16_4884 [Anabarilius grahami]|uniref:Uncharacterized protein n=1 Tax=Anabarilius grahami TaxID=495550 RepID=A0A3N0YIZ5_ANAGA|nr:hypothetical protein DPX16_4884 [Anabarilius grahami]